MTREDFIALLSSWSFSPALLLGLALVAGVYGRGWYRFQLRGATRFKPIHLASFYGGLLAVFIALQSPLDAFGPFSLQVHMVQHLLLMVVAGPLLVYGAPTLPMIAGVPTWFREDWIGPFARWPKFRFAIGRLFHPATTWCLFVFTLWFWHWPAMYELALRSSGWHQLEHATFLTSSVLFWWPVLRPYPTRYSWSPWILVPYLALAGVQGTVLSGVLTFSNRTLYAHYTTTPNLWGLSPLTDQSLAGAIMWVPTSILYLVTIVWIVGQLMTEGSANAVRRQPIRNVKPASPRNSVPANDTAALDKIPLPARREAVLLSTLFKHRSLRLGLRCIILALTMVVVADGLRGPQVSSINLAGVLPWVHWRGLLVITLLLGGNFFCMACPFTALRGFTQRIFAPTRRWPRQLQNKWLALGALVVFFWAYEAFSLWDRPFWTAIIVLGFFGTAFAFQAIFVDAPFCKFVCPIGQFNFVQSLVSPTQVAVTEPSTCAGCKTKDCIAGNDRARGCQTSLFQPQKVGNMDCTFCFDCVEACPHDNVALVQVLPVADVITDQRRSGIGRYSERPDLAALIALLFFAALVNAAWMTAPVIDLEDAAVAGLGIGRLPVMTVGMLLTLVVIPMAVLWSVAKVSIQAGNQPSSVFKNIALYAPALVPLGLGMWLSHYSFHLFTSGDTVLVATARGFSDLLGTDYSVAPAVCNCCSPTMISWLLPLELTFLDLGLCVSLVAAYRIAWREQDSQSAVYRAVAPWAVLMIFFFAFCVWVLLQPMQMRGAYLAGM